MKSRRWKVANEVNQVCQFLHSTTDEHLKAAKRILRYVKGTIAYGLTFPHLSSSSLTAYSDADWGGDPTTRRSITGSCVFLGGCLLSWNSKKQPTPALNMFMECSLTALVWAASKVPWHKRMSSYEYKMLNPHHNTGDVSLQTLARQMLLRQCVKCSHMIELAEGCYHMTCRCGYVFCYTCGAEWRDKRATCSCPLWDEQYIIGEDSEEESDDNDYYCDEDCFDDEDEDDDVVHYGYHNPHDNFY